MLPLHHADVLAASRLERLSPRPCIPDHESGTLPIREDEECVNQDSNLD